MEKQFGFLLYSEKSSETSRKAKINALTIYLHLCHQVCSPSCELTEMQLKLESITYSLQEKRVEILGCIVELKANKWRETQEKLLPF